MLQPASQSTCQVRANAQKICDRFFLQMRFLPQPRGSGNHRATRARNAVSLDAIFPRPTLFRHLQPLPCGPGPIDLFVMDLAHTSCLSIFSPRFFSVTEDTWSLTPSELAGGTDGPHVYITKASRCVHGNRPRQMLGQNRQREGGREVLDGEIGAENKYNNRARMWVCCRPDLLWCRCLLCVQASTRTRTTTTPSSTATGEAPTPSPPTR